MVKLSDHVICQAYNVADFEMSPEGCSLKKKIIMRPLGPNLKQHMQYDWVCS